MIPTATPEEKKPTRAFHVMVKPRGAICNLDCAYCFYLKKQSLYPESSFYMNDETLESLTRQYIQAQNVSEITFAWQGGEPTLMGLDFFRKAVSLQQKYRQPGQKINNSFQTNAVLMDDQWCEFFKRNNFLLGVSLDGPQDLHDIYRVDKGGAPTFDRVMRGIRLLQKYQVDFNILACVNQKNVLYPEKVYRFFRDEVNTNFIQFIPIVEKSENTQYILSDRSTTGHDYGAFLIAIFDEWVHNDVGKVFVQIFDVALAAWAGFRPGLCVHEATCGNAFAMEHNGDLYACDHFVDPEHFLGNIMKQSLVELVNLPKQRQFGRDKKVKLPRQCRQCHVRFVCNGGCPKDRLAISKDHEPGLNVLCEGYYAFFTHIDQPMRRMTELLHEQRPPAQIMEEIRLRQYTIPSIKKRRRRHIET